MQEEWIWWKHGVVYHIYVLSFFDANGDGKGDLRGIIHKLDYLQNLGVDAIWLSPVFKTSMADFGYDILDFYSVDPVFGSMDDFKELLFEAHNRNIRVILDMVINHTSAQHPWFIESRSGRDNPKRDWYIWRSSKRGMRPNNWRSAFGGSSWQFDRITGEYYLHSFFKDQPDLNWRNKAVRQEMFAMLSWWLDIGVDGFRFDVINFIVKDKKLRSNPVLLWLKSSRKAKTRNHHKSYRIIRNLRKILDKYPDRKSVGEIYTLPPGDPQLAASYLADGVNSLHLTFDFSIFFTRWHAKSYLRVIKRWQYSIPERGWPCQAFSNHDLFRAFNRRLTGRNRDLKARLLAMLLLTLKGTPFIYYGEEIGMKNGRIPYKSLQDPLGKKFWPVFSGRDRARTPMQWDCEMYSGFSAVKPWLPVNDDFPEKNVSLQLGDPDSLHALYQQLIRLRKNTPALSAGDWVTDCSGRNGIIYFERNFEHETLFIILNFSSSIKKIVKNFGKDDTIIFSTSMKEELAGVVNPLILGPYEGKIARLEKNY